MLYILYGIFFCKFAATYYFSGFNLYKLVQNYGIKVVSAIFRKIKLTGRNITISHRHGFIIGPDCG